LTAPSCAACASWCSFRFPISPQRRGTLGSVFFPAGHADLRSGYREAFPPFRWTGGSIRNIAPECRIFWRPMPASRWGMGAFCCRARPMPKPRKRERARWADAENTRLGHDQNSSPYRTFEPAPVIPPARAGALFVAGTGTGNWAQAGAGAADFSANDCPARVGNLQIKTSKHHALRCRHRAHRGGALIARTGLGPNRMPRSTLRAPVNDQVHAEKELAMSHPDPWHRPITRSAGTSPPPKGQHATA
jgi:hypothetical protein